MKLYFLFVLMAALTVSSPGPSVLMTLTNALRYGYRGTVGGIVGISFGTLVVAVASAMGLGVLLTTSALAFTIMKFAGAAYLTYLGVRLWLAPALRFDEGAAHRASFGKRFTEGISLQLTNPKVIFFFLSVFPQFVDPSHYDVTRFATLVLTYSTLILAIHSAYALFAQRAKLWLTSERGGRIINLLGGATFIFFGVMMAIARR
jgi:threonine/homoserine/homoserine lactone efflux protein